MRRIREIARRDFARIRGNTVALVVAVGLVVVPALYAWFNIAGSWDPYGNTDNLTVAVANTDEGYRSDLVPVQINMGDSVVSALRENDQLKWVFVSEEEAVRGVKSGAYYAAVVIPGDFSANLMTLFSTHVEHSSLVYYENQKANAIAPRVTSAGSSTVREQVDEAFAATIGEVGLSATSGLLDMMDGDQVMNYVANLSSTLEAGIASLSDAADMADSFAGTLGSTSGMLSSTGDLLLSAGSTSDDAQAALADAKEGVADVRESLGAAGSAISGALAQGAASYDEVSAAVDRALDAAGTQAGDTAAALRSVAADVQARVDETRGLRDRVAALPDQTGLLASIVTRFDAAIQKQEQLRDRLVSAADALDAGTGDIQASQKEIDALIAEAKGAMTDAQREYETTLASQAQSLRDALQDVEGSAERIAGDLDATVAGLGRASSSLAGDLNGVGKTLAGVSSDLRATGEDLGRMRDELDEAAATGDIAKIRLLIGSDPEALAEALAAPVALERHAVFHIENYGSAMAPFYTAVSLWVGGIVLAAMLEANVRECDRASLPGVRLHELYLGRFCLFAVLSLCQSTLMCAGDILLFGIQCEHPLQFIAAGWLAGFVFVNVIYTLTVSFGDIGKALAVVLLVMQVGGSGGTFPIEMTSGFFQAVYPYLPAAHVINAMHAAIAGSYGAEFLTEMLAVAAYLIPSLALGLVFRRPVVRANAWISERLEATKLM